MPEIPALIPLHEQFDNHDEFQPPLSDGLAGAEPELHFDAGPVVSLSFPSATAMRWTSEPALRFGRSGEEACEVMELRPGIFAVITARLDERASALTIVDLEARRAVVNLSRLVDGPKGVVEDTRVYHAGVDGPLGEPIAPTTELVGKRVHHRYSTTHAFEHIYLSESMYAFQGLAGPEKGIAEVSPTDAHKVADGLYLFSWHEYFQPFNGAIALDLREGRACGRLFGWDAELGRALQVRTGSKATLLNETSYAGL